MTKTLLAYTNSNRWTTNNHIGQMARYINTAYKEHISSIKCNKDDSAIRILNNRYQHGRIEDIINKTGHAKKG